MRGAADLDGAGALDAGEVQRAARVQRKQQVLELLRRRGRELYCVEVAEALGISRMHAKHALTALELDGAVTSWLVPGAECGSGSGLPRRYFRIVATSSAPERATTPPAHAPRAVEAVARSGGPQSPALVDGCACPVQPARGGGVCMFMPHCPVHGRSAGLSDRQRELCRLVADGVAGRGFAPTVRELLPLLGVTSTNGVAGLIDAAERKGAVTNGGASQVRSLRVLPIAARDAGGARG